MLPLEIRNPKDLNSTYLQIEISRADAYGGTYSVVKADLDIDITTASDLSQGYTSYGDSTGDTTKWYKFRYRNGSTYSPYSNEYQGGTCEMDARFRIEMRDINPNDYFFDNTTIANFRKDAVFSLYPATWNEALDETLTTLANTVKYAFPYGVTRINDIDFVDSTTGAQVGAPKNWKPRARQIVFTQVPQVGLIMRLYVDKMITKISEVPEIFDEYILDYMKYKAYKVFEADRTQYFKYNTVIKGDGSAAPAISRTIMVLKDSLDSRLNSLRRARKPADISLSN